MLPLTSVARHRNGCGWSNRFFSSLEHDKVRVDGKSLTGMLMDVDPRLTMHNDIELLSPHQIPSGASVLDLSIGPDTSIVGTQKGEIWIIPRVL